MNENPAAPAPTADAKQYARELYLALGTYRLLCTLRPDGSVLFQEAGEDRGPLSRWLSPMPVEALSFLNAQIGETDVAISPGLTLLVAQTGWGKTVLLERILRAPSIAHISVGEVPSLQALEEDWLVGGLDDALRRMITLAWGDFVAARERLIVIDSLRELVYGRSLGGTGEGGVNLFASMQLTALSVALLGLDAKVLATFNPLIDRDQDRGEARWGQLLEVLRGSCAIWEARESTAFTVWDRGPLSPDRSPQSVLVPRVALVSPATAPLDRPASPSVVIEANALKRPSRLRGGSIFRS